MACAPWGCATKQPAEKPTAAGDPGGAPSDAEPESGGAEEAVGESADGTEPVDTPECDGLAQGQCDEATGFAWNEAGEFSACYPSDPTQKCAVGDTPKMCGLLDGCRWTGEACTPAAP